jgi:hypothetical protein
VTIAQSESGATRRTEQDDNGDGAPGTTSISAYSSQQPATAQLVWQDPPPNRRRRVLTAEIVDQLRANPGRWAVIRQYPNRTAVKGGGVVKHPTDIEVRGVEEPPGSVLYVRAKPTESMSPRDDGVQGGGR